MVIDTFGMLYPASWTLYAAIIFGDIDSNFLDFEKTTPVVN